MTPFLQQVAQIFYSKYSDNLYPHTFIFPNRRAGLFFQKYLTEIAGKPFFSPRIITINEFIGQLSIYQEADRVELLVILYKIYTEISSSNESFDDFVYWGEMLLSDFDDVDKYLIDAKQLFNNVTDLKSIDDHATYLTEEQIAAIRQFWTNFIPYENSKTKQEFIDTWRVLYPLYNQFRNTLHQRKRTYQGMIYREVVEKITKNEELTLPEGELVFVGLHALSNSELQILQQLQQMGKADFYWDYESDFFNDTSNKASMWIKRNKSMFPSKHPIEFINSNRKINLEAIGIPSGVGQAKQTTAILNRLIDEGDIKNTSEAINSAIILPNENFLLPTLYSIPSSIDKINVTMGYSLSNSALSGLIRQMIDVQKKVKYIDNKRHYYFRFVLSILNNPLIRIATKATSDKLKTDILNNNLVLVPESNLNSHPLLASIFENINEWSEIADYLKRVLSSLYNYLTKEELNNEMEEIEEVEEVNESAIESVDLEREFIVQYYKTIVKLEESLEHEKVLMTFDTYFRLLDRLASSISISFRGEPLSGLQIMGVLETRALDFENIIILSMNEGVFPIKKSTNSFIPYTLRKGFDMPTYEFQDSIFAYHFYRLISRAKNVFLLYDTRTEDIQMGEVSRYFHQIKYLYPHKFNIKEELFNYEVKSSNAEPISIKKTESVWKKLNQFSIDNGKALSASSINTYIDCPLRFYLLYVENLSEEEEIEESVENAVFGSIFHLIMQTIYDRYENKIVDKSILQEISNNDEYITHLLEHAFAELFTKQKGTPKPLKGNNYLIGETLRTYIKQVLKIDSTYAPFKYIKSEMPLKRQYRVTDNLIVNFKGSIDRVDEKEGITRIIDYKSGQGELNFKSFEELFDSSKESKIKPILQVLIYAYFYSMQSSNSPISPHIYYMRTSFKNFSSIVTYNNQAVVDVSPFLEEFKEFFNGVIEEIFNRDIDFIQTDNEKNCKYCPFKDFCNR